ncbi:hypothetical protein PAE9249_05002 [Paenibacillus sp. CECT 9249]|uniref:MFS transporter n=1 Tax=Paenibacillus sp. CECT 9249 TaxID=2845385 RepID=UPI001E607C10|nr:MFS transporter [Paenibacillus sp. CECT 9249]CAH0122451.1 hypothetical protein PAE9249_05002 [Paenibacillus sp. CECT 9249]
MEKKSTLGVFKNDNYRKLFSATVTSQMGREIGMSAFAFYLLERFGEQPVYTTLTQMMYSLPTLVVFFIVGVVADRMDRQKIAANSDWISAGLSIMFLGAVTLGWMPLIFAILFLRSAVANFFAPAEAAMVQGVLHKDEYTTAAGLNQMVMSVFMLFGTALGLFFYRFIGIQGAILVDAAAFLLSGWFIRTCRMSDKVRLPNGRTTWRQLQFGNVVRDFKDGMIYILKNKLLLAIISGFFLFGIVNGGFSVLFMYVTKYKLDPVRYETSMVALSMLFGVAIMAGSIFATFMAKKVKLYQMLIGGILMAGILVTLSGFASSKAVFYGLAFFTGLTLGPINVAIGGWMPQIVDPKMMGRVQGWINPLMMLAQTATLGVIAVAFPRFINVDMLFYGIGTVILIVAVYYIATLPRLAAKHQQQTEQAQVVTG